MSGFAIRKAEFTALNTELLGLSIDSIHSHLAWVNNVREKTGVYFSFPIIADIDMKVSKLYGMLQPNESETAAVRAVFFINLAKKFQYRFQATLQPELHYLMYSRYHFRLLRRRRC